MSMITEDQNKLFINALLSIAERQIEGSTCLRRNYGCIIMDPYNKRILGTGRTQSPPGWINCKEAGLNACYRIQNDIPSGTAYEICRSVHAEQMAIIEAGCDLKGTILFLVGHESDGSYVKDTRPCSICSRLIAQAGIEEIYVRINEDEYEHIFVSDLPKF